MSESTPETSTATRQVVVFTFDKEEYAIPIEQVEEVVKTPKLTLVPNGPTQVAGVMNLRGQIVPVLNLGAIFNLHRDTRQAAEHVVVTTDASQTLFGVQVDAVREVLRVPSATLKPAPKMVQSRVSADYIEGVIIIPSPDEAAGSERMILLLNIEKIVTANVPAGAKMLAEGEKPTA